MLKYPENIYDQQYLYLMTALLRYRLITLSNFGLTADNQWCLAPRRFCVSCGSLCFYLKEDTERTIASLADCCNKGTKNAKQTKENSCMYAALGVRVRRGCSVPIGGVLHGLVCRTVLRLNRRWPLPGVLLMRVLACRSRLGGLPRSNSGTADEQSHVCCCCHRTRYKLRSLVGGQRSKFRTCLIATVACLSTRSPTAYEIRCTWPM